MDANTFERSNGREDYFFLHPKPHSFFYASIGYGKCHKYDCMGFIWETLEVESFQDCTIKEKILN